MTDNSKELDKIVASLVARADRAMDEEAENYDAILGESIEALQKAVAEKNTEEAIVIAYSIKGAAGTMGWPLASQAAGFLRHVLEEEEKVSKLQDTISVHLHTLDLIYKNKMKGDEPEGVELIKNLYNLLLAYHINPGM